MGQGRERETGKEGESREGEREGREGEGEKLEVRGGKRGRARGKKERLSMLFLLSKSLRKPGCVCTQLLAED